MQKFTSQVWGVMYLFDDKTGPLTDPKLLSQVLNSSATRWNFPLQNNLKNLDLLLEESRFSGIVYEGKNTVL